MPASSETLTTTPLAASGVATAGAGTWARVGPREHAHSLSVPVRRVALFFGKSPRVLAFALPAVQALRDGLPGARICAWVRPSLAPLLRGCPILDEVHVRPRSVSANAALLARLRAGEWDVAVCFNRSRHSALLTWATSAPIRAGFSPSAMEALFSHRVVLERDAVPGDFLELARIVGGRVEHAGARALLSLSSAQLSRADRVLEAAGLSGEFVLLAPERHHERDEARELPFAEAALSVAQRWPVAILESAPAPARLEPLRCADDAIARLNGRFDWALIAALCARARGFVGRADGEIAPLAGVLNPCCALFGDGALLPDPNVRRAFEAGNAVELLARSER